MTDTEIIEKLAVFVGWEKMEESCYDEQTMYMKNVGTGKGEFIADWNPLNDWNHWRMVEEKVMEDDKIWCDFIKAIQPDQILQLDCYMQADLPERCKALVSILPLINET